MRLHPAAPWHWSLTHPFIQAMDHGVLVLKQASGTWSTLLVSALPLAVVVWIRRRRKASAGHHAPAVWVGLAFAALEGAYLWARLDPLVDPFRFRPASLLSTFLLTTAGAFLFTTSRSWWSRTSALVIATFPMWAMAVLWLGGPAFVNFFGARPRLGFDLYNYNLGLMPLAGFVVQLALVTAVFAILRGRLQPEESA